MDRLARWIIHACARAAERARLLVRMVMKLADQTTRDTAAQPYGHGRRADHRCPDACFGML